MNWDWLNWALVRDIVQIAILYLAIYAILKAARGSRFGDVRGDRGEQGGHVASGQQGGHGVDFPRVTSKLLHSEADGL